jgi:ADP-ribose pyrophosphatase
VSSASSVLEHSFFSNTQASELQIQPSPVVAVQCPAMSEFDTADCLNRYRALVREQPDRFINPDGDIYEILLDDERIERARRDAFNVRQALGLPTDDMRVGVLAVDPYLLLMREAVRFADGGYGLYNRLMVPAGVAILPVVGDAIALLHRFRHGTRAWHLEAPRGVLTGSGTRVEEAERELLEEMGTPPLELTDLGELHSTSGCIDEILHLYLARIGDVGRPDQHEAIAAIEVLPVPTVEQLVAEGRITDAPTLALFLRARLRGYV